MLLQMNARIAQTLERAVGPAPWYWPTFPAIPRLGGEPFKWRFVGNDGPLAFVVALVEDANAKHTRLILGTHTRPFQLRTRRLGLWFERDGVIELLVLEPELLAPIPIARPTDPKAPFVCAGDPLAAMTIPCGLAEGEHERAFPEEMKSLEQLFVIASNPQAGPRDPSCSILELLPPKDRIRVFPQKWFTSESTDVGYQGITRAARDPSTGHIVGDGIRID